MLTVHGELVKEHRGDIVVAILQFYDNSSLPVSIPDIKPEAKVAKPEAKNRRHMFTLQDGPQQNADYADGRVQQLGKFKGFKGSSKLLGKFKTYKERSTDHNSQGNAGSS